MCPTRHSAHDQGSVSEEATVAGDPGIARDLTAHRQRLGEEPGAEQASRTPDRQGAGAAVVLPSRDLGRTLPKLCRALPVEGPLGGVRGSVECAECGLEAQDGHGACPLLCDSLQVAGSHPLQRCCRVCMSRGLTVRTEVAVGVIALPGGEPDQAALDDHEPVALCTVHRPQKIRRRQAADVDRELKVELVTQDRQGADQLGCGTDVPIHPTDSSP